MRKYARVAELQLNYSQATPLYGILGLGAVRRRWRADGGRSVPRLDLNSPIMPRNQCERTLEIFESRIDEPLDA
jgi:hypothetical protein